MASENAPGEKISKADRDTLFDAIQSGDDETVREVLDRVPLIVSTLSDTFCFYLHLACMYNQEKICEHLLYHGADLKLTDDQGDTPLHIALCHEADLKIIQLLLINGASLTMQNKEGKSAFHNACASGSFDYVYCLVNHPEANPSQKDLYGYNGLHVMIQNLEEFEDESLKVCIAAVLKSGLDINDQDADGWTVLHHAAFNSGFDLIPHLLDLGADPFLCDRYGNSLMTILEDKLSSEEFNELVVNVVQKLEDGKCSVLHSCNNTVNKAAQKFINLQNLSGEGIIHMFLGTAQLSTLQYLVEKGADVNLQDNIGQSPLHLCVKMEEEQNKLKFLLKHGAEIDIRDVNGRTPLFEVIDSNHAEILLAYRADLNAVDKIGMKPLQVAALNHRLDVVETLLSNGAIVNNQDRNGSTALHYASWWSFEKIIEILKEHGADPTIVDINGKTPAQVLLEDKISQNFRWTSKLQPDTPQSEEKEKRAEESRLQIAHEKSTALRKEMFCLDLATTTLSTPRLGLLLNAGEVAHVKQAVFDLLNKMMHHVSNIDPRFEGRLFPTGSSTEGTRVGEPNEFDFLYFLDKFSEACDIAENYHVEDGFVQLKAKDVRPAYSQYFDGSGILNGNSVRDTLRKLIGIAIAQKEMWNANELYFSYLSNDCLKPVLNLEVSYIGSFFKCLEISIDIVPAVYKQAWWPSTVRPESFGLMTDSIRNAGCSVLFQNPSNEIVPDENANMYMRISCAPAEIALFKLLPAYVKKSYALIKVLLSSKICPPVDTTDIGGDPLPAGYYISSYMIKNCLLQELAQKDEKILPSLITEKPSINDHESDKETEVFPVKETNSDCDHLYESKPDDISETVDLTKKILLRLRDCMEACKLPAYFLRSVNILGYEYRTVYGEDYDKVETSIREKDRERKQVISNLLDFLGTKDCDDMDAAESK